LVEEAGLLQKDLGRQQAAQRLPDDRPGAGRPVVGFDVGDELRFEEAHELAGAAAGGHGREVLLVFRGRSEVTLPVDVRDADHDRLGHDVISRQEVDQTRHVEIIFMS
jgi:hypothetical protein